MSILKLASTCLINAPAQKPHKQVVNQSLQFITFTSSSQKTALCPCNVIRTQIKTHFHGFL